MTIHLIRNIRVTIFLKLKVVVFLIHVGVTVFLQLMWYVYYSINFVYLNFCLSKQQESVNTIPATETVQVFLPASAEVIETSLNLAIEVPPVTDDNLRKCTNVSCCVIFSCFLYYNITCIVCKYTLSNCVSVALIMLLYSLN